MLASPPVRLEGSQSVVALHQSGQHAEALRRIGELLGEQIEQHGRSSKQAAEAASASVRLCNELALACMQRGTPWYSLECAYIYLAEALQGNMFLDWGGCHLPGFS